MLKTDKKTTSVYTAQTFLLLVSDGSMGPIRPCLPSSHTQWPIWSHCYLKQHVNTIKIVKKCEIFKPKFCTWLAKRFQLQGGEAPWFPDQGLCPLTALGAKPKIPIKARQLLDLPVLLVFHCVSKKDPRHYRLQLQAGLSDFNNFWYSIPDMTGHQTTIQVPTFPMFVPALPGKTEQCTSRQSALEVICS